MSTIGENLPLPRREHKRALFIIRHKDAITIRTLSCLVTSLMAPRAQSILGCYHQARYESIALLRSCLAQQISFKNNTGREYFSPCLIQAHCRTDVWLTHGFFLRRIACPWWSPDGHSCWPPMRDCVTPQLPVKIIQSRWILRVKRQHITGQWLEIIQF